MPEELLTFQKFRDPEIANDIAQKLKDADVHYQMEDDNKFFDPTFANNPMAKETRIKLRSADFERANKVLNEYYASQANNISSDYYLFDFNNKELFDILRKPDEWGNLDYALAQKILADRGENIENAELDYFKDKRIKELSVPEPPHSFLMWFGYAVLIYSALRLAPYLSFIGVVAGLVLRQSSKTLPNGTTMKVFSKNDRFHGGALILIGLGIFLFFFLKQWLYSATN